MEFKKGLLKMSIDIRWLTYNDRNSALLLLNSIFSAANERFEDFRNIFPRIFSVNVEKNIPQHIGAFENGKLIGISAAYFLNYRIGDDILHVCANGNIAVANSARGKGIMGAMFEKIESDTSSKCDISYLHGKKGRYRLFGYEECGAQYNISFTRHMLKNTVSVRYIFSDMRSNSFNGYQDELMTIYKRKFDYIERSSEEFIPALTACGRIPICISDEQGGICGYFSYDSGKESIEEFGFKNYFDADKILKSFMNFIQKDISIRVNEYDKDLLDYLIRISENYTVSAPALFKINHFENVVRICLKNKVKNNKKLPYGSLCIKSDMLKSPLFIENKKEGVWAEFRPDAEKYDIELNGYELHRFLFGIHRQKYIGDERDIWFPLPLYIPYLS